MPRHRKINLSNCQKLNPCLLYLSHLYRFWDTLFYASPCGKSTIIELSFIRIVVVFSIQIAEGQSVGLLDSDAGQGTLLGHR